MQKLQTVNADTLLYEPLEKPPFVVDGLIPTGLTLFCGSWDMHTQEGDVLYLCL